jgi:outer membrane cobalamin receptor
MQPITTMVGCMMSRIALSIVFAGLLAPSVRAQTTPQPRLHESVVVSAAAEPVPFEAAGRAVSVLTRAEIARLPVHSLDDLVRFVSSVDVRARGPRVQSDFSVRGAGFGQTLVLVDGVRINDAQSGHHNSDIPLTLDDVERVEVLLGSGSSLFGADALGGTINVITGAASPGVRATVSGGQHDLGSGRARVDLEQGRIRQSFAGEVSHSSGFMPARDFDTVAASSRTAIGANTRLLFGYGRKDFGANGFYGPAPSHEKTDQTLVSLDHAFALSSWRASVQAMYRTHGDWFLYDPRVAGAVANRHRTQAVTMVARASRKLGTHGRINAGTEVGGDWIDSNNLGDHTFRRGSGFVELQERVGSRVFLYPGVRYDAYSRFGDAWSPSLATRVAVAGGVSLRASAGHAFRVPTFTELYYRDPNHQARDTLTPERGWSTEGGVDWIVGPQLMARATLFTRRDRDVIDWIRPSAAVRWQTTNVRRVNTTGGEIGLRQLLGRRGWIDVQYTRLTTEATALAGVLSKYVLEYAPHALVASGSVQAPSGFAIGHRVAWTRRNDGRSDPVVDLKVSRPIRRFTLFVDAANLFDRRYEEIKGVVMPGRWVSAGLAIQP